MAANNPIRKSRVLYGAVARPVSARRTTRCGVAGPAACALLAWGSTTASPGDLDPTFGNGGRLSMDLASPSGMTFAATEQADGRIVLAGSLYDRADLALLRFEANGTLDVSFGDGGLVLLDPLPTGSAEAVIQQADGKLAVAGTLGDVPAIWRFLPDGSPDPGFGDAGVATANARFVAGIAAILQTPDGKLVIAFSGEVGAKKGMAVARFDADGTPDATFGRTGIASIDFGDGEPAYARTLARQQDAKLLVAGDREGELAVARVTGDGALDPTFGDGGTLQIAVDDDPETYSWATAAAVQDDGRIVLAGAVGREYPWDVFVYAVDGLVLRLQPDGARDTSFGDDGLVLSDYESAEGFTSLILETDGSLVVATNGLWFDGGEDMALARFNAVSGDVDTGFGIGGTSVADFGTADIRALTLTGEAIRLNDGKYLVVGHHSAPNSDLGWKLAVARFGNDDTGFPGVIGLGSAGADVDEESESVSFSVRRTGGSKGAVSVTFATADGSAVAGSDYIAQTGRLEWEDGDASVRTITLQLLNDDVAGSFVAETFELRLDDVTGGAMLATSTATVAVSGREAGSPAQSTGAGGLSGPELLLLWLFVRCRRRLLCAAQPG